MRIAPLPILFMEFLFWSEFWLLEIFRPTSIINLHFGFSWKLSMNRLRLFLLMFSTAFGFNCFPNTYLGFFGLNNLRFWFNSRNPRRGGQTGCGATETFAFVLLPPKRRSIRLSFCALARRIWLDNFGLGRPNCILTSNITSWQIIARTISRLLNGRLLNNRNWIYALFLLISSSTKLSKLVIKLIVDLQCFGRSNILNSSMANIFILMMPFSVTR